MNLKTQIREIIMVKVRHFNVSRCAGGEEHGRVQGGNGGDGHTNMS